MRPVVQKVQFISGCRKGDFTAAWEPCLPLATASIVWENANAGSECFQWKTARIVRACIGLKGGVFPAASPFSLLSSIFIEWPVRLQQHTGLTRQSTNGQPPPTAASRPHLPILVPPKNWIFSPVPPLLTQHYKVWRSVHSLLLVESDKGGVAGGTGSTREWVGVTSNLRRQLKRCMENIRGCWRRWRRSDPRQRALRNPPFIPPLPHPQSLRRPCLRGRRGSSTIANGSAAEWWRGVMKPITTPINRALKGILSDRLKPARCTRRASGNSDFLVIWRKEGCCFLLAGDYFPPLIKPSCCLSLEFLINIFQKIRPVSFTERCPSIYTQPPSRLHSLSQSIYSVSPFLSILL